MPSPIDEALTPTRQHVNNTRACAFLRYARRRKTSKRDACAARPIGKQHDHDCTSEAVMHVAQHTEGRDLFVSDGRAKRQMLAKREGTQYSIGSDVCADAPERDVRVVKRHTGDPMKLWYGCVRSWGW